jgi:sulfatase modifying factor 1
MDDATGTSDRHERIVPLGLGSRMVSFRNVSPKADRRFHALVAFAGLVAALVTAATSCTKTTVAGVMLVFDCDKTLEPDTLHVTVTPSGGSPILDACYAIASPRTFFPTTLAVASDGNPATSFAVVASVSKNGVTLDVQQNEVRQIPTDHVMNLPVLFSARCLEQTCAPTTGKCVSSVVSTTGGLDGGADGVAATASGADGSSGVGVGAVDSSANDGTAEGSEGTALDGSDAAPDTGLLVTSVSAPSCAPGGAGMTDCRPGDGGPESCCTSLLVPGGTFYRTYDPTGGAPDGGPVTVGDPATISSFSLDKYLVTVGRFRQFVKAWKGGWTPPPDSGKHSHLNGGRGLVDVGVLPDAGVVYETGWQASDNVNIAISDTGLVCQGDATWTPAPGASEHLPINCESWLQARAFCIWDAGFLPSEAEWEYAAAGGSEQREYPWGSTAPGTMSQYAIYGCYYPNGDRNCVVSAAYAPVGYPALGAGRWGQLDLEGEVVEWNLDWYRDSYSEPCTDCSVLTQGVSTELVIGGCTENDTYLFPSQRGSNDPIEFIGDTGFRCARVP